MQAHNVLIDSPVARFAVGLGAFGTDSDPALCTLPTADFDSLVANVASGGLRLLIFSPSHDRFTLERLMLDRDTDWRLSCITCDRHVPSGSLRRACRASGWT